MYEERRTDTPAPSDTLRVATPEYRRREGGSRLETLLTHYELTILSPFPGRQDRRRSPTVTLLTLPESELGSDLTVPPDRSLVPVELVSCGVPVSAPPPLHTGHRRRTPPFICNPISPVTSRESDTYDRGSGPVRSVVSLQSSASPGSGSHLGCACRYKVHRSKVHTTRYAPRHTATPTTHPQSHKHLHRPDPEPAETHIHTCTHRTGHTKTLYSVPHICVKYTYYTSHTPPHIWHTIHTHTTPHTYNPHTMHTHPPYYTYITPTRHYTPYHTHTPHVSTRHLTHTPYYTHPHNTPYIHPYTIHTHLTPHTQIHITHTHTHSLKDPEPHTHTHLGTHTQPHTTPTEAAHRTNLPLHKCSLTHSQVQRPGHRPPNHMYTVGKIRHTRDASGPGTVSEKGVRSATDRCRDVTLSGT